MAAASAAARTQEVYRRNGTRRSGRTAAFIQRSTVRRGFRVALEGLGGLSCRRTAFRRRSAITAYGGCLSGVTVFTADLLRRGDSATSGTA